MLYLSTLADILVTRSGHGVTLNAVKIPWFFGVIFYLLNDHKIQILQRYSNLKFLPTSSQICDASKVGTQTR